MTTKSGRNAKITKGTYTVAEFASWNLSIDINEVDTSSFGSVWGKSDVGMQKWSLGITGHYDPTDTTGQTAIQTASLAGTLMNDIKIWVDSASYWIADVTTESAAGCRVTNFAIDHAHDGVAGISFTLAGSGPITFV